MDTRHPDPLPPDQDQFALQGALMEAEAETAFLRGRNRALARLVVALRARLAQVEGADEGGTR